MDPLTVISLASTAASGIAKIFGGGGDEPAPPPDNRQQLANEANQQLERNEQELRDHNNNVADIQNAYNWNTDTASAQDFIAQQDYQYGLAVSDWQFGKSIQDFEYLQKLKAYQKSLGIASSQLNLNDLA